MKKTTISLLAAAVLAFAPAADAQTLQTYFNFTTYGTQSGGAVLTDLTGHTVGTLTTDSHNSLTSSGLTISSGGSSPNTGVQIGSSYMSGFTGSFSIQMWVTLSAVTDNQILFGANNYGSVGNNRVASGPTGSYPGSTLFGAIRFGGISAYVGGSTPSYSQWGYGVADSSGAASTATLYDIVLTYDGTNFREYVNGTLKGTLNMPTFGSLATASALDSSTGKGGFSIGGGMNNPFNDAALPGTTSNFLLYNGALSQSQITSIHNLGAGASLSSINSVLGVSVNNAVWNGGGSDNTWTNAANWVSGSAPSSGDFVTFAGTTQTNVNLVASSYLGSLTFSNNAGSFAITNSGSTLTLGGSLTNNSASPQTVAVPVVFSGAQTINATAGNVALTGGVSGSTLTIVGNGRMVTLSGANTYAGNAAIQGSSLLVLANTATQTNSSVVTGTGTLVKSGAGTLVLTGTNNFTGTMTVSNGTLLVTKVAGQSLGTNINVRGGATFGITATADTNYLSPATMTVGSGGGATLQFAIAGTNHAPLKPTTLTLGGTTTINITKCPYALTNFPLITGYTSGALVLGSQPTGWTGQLTVNGGTVYYTVTGLDPNLKPFVHPGCLSTLADLQRMKAKYEAGAQPWASGFDALASNPKSSANYTAYPHPTPCRGDCVVEDYLTMCRDASAAYQCALRYRITGDPAFADAAVRNMDGYANTVQYFQGSSDVLLMLGAQGFQWACAAELMRDYQPWVDSGGFGRFQSFLLNKFYANYDPPWYGNGLHAFLESHNNTCWSHYWLNWDFFAMDAVIAIAVVCDRRDIYNEAINYYQNGVGNGNAHHALWFMHPGYLGQHQEIGRDPGHSSLDAVLLGQYCEVAWNQGDDMYGYNNNTLLAISEYTYKMMTTWDVPWVNYAGCDWSHVQPAYGSQYRPGADLIWNHYVNRKGLAAPYTMPWAIGGRPENGGGAYGEASGGYDQIGFTTLTHALDPITNSPAPSGVVAEARNANQALVWWWGSAYATSYKVKRSTSVNGPFTQVGTVAGNGTHLFTDYCLTPGTTYYYAVSAVVNGVETTNSLPASVLANQRLTGWVIGTDGAVTYGQWKDQMFDNAPITFFDAPTASGCWGGLDLGAPHVITKVGYYPRANFAYRMTGGQFQACNVADFSSGVVTLYTINSQPAEGTTTVQNVSNPGAFRYVRYLGPDNGYCNAAEIQFQGYPSPALAPSVPWGLAAAESSAQVTLSWNGAPGVTGFNVKRATTSGGPYTQIATNLSAAFYVDTNVVNYTAYYYVVTAINATGQSGNSSEVSATPSDMAVHLKFNETSGTTAVDASGNGNSASLMSGAAWATGILSNSVHLNGTTNGYLTLPSGVVNGISDFTASAWVKTDVSAMWARVFDFGSGTGTYMYLAPVGGTGTVRYEILSGGIVQQLNSPSAMSVGVWHHLAVSQSGATGILYVDGVAVTTNSSLTLKPSSLGNTTQNYIGKSQFVDPYLTGSVDDFRFYTHALNSSEVLALTLTPSIPGGLTAVPGDAQVALTWNAVSGATSYNLKRAPVSGGSYTTVTNIAGTSFTNTGLVNLTTYYYVVSAVTAKGETPNSAEVSATPYNSAPPVPLNLTATPGNGRATLRWNAALTASGYKLWRSTSSGSGYAQIGSTASTSYLDLGAVNGTAYYYVVSATNTLGESAISTEANATPHLITVVWSGALNSVWDSTSTNWLDGGTPTLYQDADTVILNDSVAGGSTLSIPAAVAPLQFNVNNTAVNYAISGSAIGGAGSLVKSGFGTLALNSVNTFSGGTTNNGGTINLGNAKALGTGSLVLNGGVLGNLAQITFTNNIVIGSGANAIQLASGNNLTLTGTVSGNGSLTLGNSGYASSLYLSGTNAMSGGMVLVANNANYVRFTTPAAGNGNADWLFLNANAWQTTFDFASGTIHFGSLSGDGSMQGNVVGSMNVNLQVGGNNNPASFSGVIHDNGAGTGPIGLTKTGTGTQWLTGACDYSGATVVSNGELVISTALAGKSSCSVSSGATLGVTNLSSSSATISNLTLAAGSTLELMNVTDPAVPFLKGSNVVVSGVCTVKVTQASSTIPQATYALVNYTGKFQGSFANLQLQLPPGITGMLVSNANQIALTITTPTPPPTPATLTAVAGNAQVLLNWSSAISATSYNVRRSPTSGSGYVTITNVAATAFLDTGLVNGTTYYYVVSATNAYGESANSPEASATPQMIVVWTGATNANWNFTTTNWSLGGSIATFANGAIARFDDTALSNVTVNVVTTVSPLMTVVSNSAQSYAFSGSPIAGTGSLVKSGSGTLTMSGANTYSGGTTNNSGSIVLGASSTGSGNSVTSGPLGTGKVTLSGGTLQLNAKTLGNHLAAATNTTSVIDNTGADGYLDGNLTGGGTVTFQNSSGVGLSLKIAQNAAVNWSGFTGTLNYNAANGQVFNVFMPSSFNLSNATLNTGGAGTPPGNWSSLRAGGTNLVGALSGTKGYLDFGGVLVIGSLNTNSTFGGTIVNAGGLVKVGTGTLTLSSANTYTGNTTVSNGMLLITTVSAAKGNHTVVNGATLGVNNTSGSSALVSNLIVAAGSTLEFQNVASPTMPLIAASNVTVNGSCTVKLTGAGGLVAGYSYPLVSYAGTLSGSFANLRLQMPYGWRGTLANFGKQIVVTNVAVVATTPPQMDVTPGGAQLQLSWPGTHTGWRLLMNTNLAIPNWTDVSSNSVTMTNKIYLPVAVTNGSVFYKLVYP